MRKILFSVIFSTLLLLVGCGKEINQADLVLVNGYWEIEKAKLPDGAEKDYTVNGTIDYFEVDSLGVGFRQKVMPQFSGEFLTNDVPEQLVILNEGGKTLFSYKTDYSEWKEELVKLNEKELVVKNENNIIYYYKKADPVSVKK